MLGENSIQRNSVYQTLFDKQLDKADEITRATERGEVYGGQPFHDYIATLVDGPQHGGDRKSAEYKDQAG